MGLFNDENITEILNSLIKIGEVSSVNYAKGTARVVFDDDDSIVSYDLQVLQKNTIANKDYAMPDIGEDVICLFLPSGPEDGFILGSVYAGEITPPESSSAKRTVVFADDTKISYDRETHTLSINIGETTILADSKNVNVVAPENINAKAGKKITGEAPTIDLIGNLNIKGNVNISGSMSVEQNIQAADVKTATVASVNAHTHTSADPGKPTSAPNG